MNDVSQRVPAVFALHKPHLVDEALGVAAWFTEPLGVLSTFLHPRPIDAAVAQFITEVLHIEVQRRRRPGQRTVALHDWSLATSYTTSVRVQLTQWTWSHREEFSHVALVGPRGESPLLKMGAQVSAAAMAAVGFPFEITDSLDDVVARLALTPSLRAFGG